MPAVAVAAVLIARPPTTMLAHQGGWDEFLWVAAPIVAVFGLLRVANSRARRIESERADPGRGDDLSRSD